MKEARPKKKKKRESTNYMILFIYKVLEIMTESTSVVIWGWGYPGENNNGELENFRE